jgi:hypothetical protein
VPAGGCVAAAGTELAGEEVVEVVLLLAHDGGALPDVRLLLLDPERLGQHPLGAERALSIAIHAQSLFPLHGIYPVFLESSQFRHQVFAHLSVC